MSSMIALKNKEARGNDAALNVVQYFLMIAGFLIVLAAINVLVGNRSSAVNQQTVLPDLSTAEASLAVVEKVAPVEAADAVLSPRMQGALDYVKRRYKVSSDAVEPIFEVAQLIGTERRIDPLLIVAIIGVESGFNPFAESSFGAQGLMQIIPRFHKDKLPAGAGENPLLDPLINIKVGVHVLEEAIRRRGGLIPGLQQYAGSSDTQGGYASKVLAEKERLEQAARRNAANVTPTPSA